MNFLAHTFLSCNDEHLLIGNFLADFVTNKEVALMPEAVQRGVLLHRKIDSYTDKHDVVRQGAKRLRRHHGKYAPVIIDVFYDYLLTRHWSLYSEENLRDFTQWVYHILEKKLALMPQHLHHPVSNMIAHDWLMGYSTIEGIAYTFERMKRRVTYPELLSQAIRSLKNDLAFLDEEFNLFFPDVIAYIASDCQC